MFKANYLQKDQRNTHNYHLQSILNQCLFMWDLKMNFDSVYYCTPINVNIENRAISFKHTGEEKKTTPMVVCTFVSMGEWSNLEVSFSSPIYLMGQSLTLEHHLLFIHITYVLI